MEAKFSVWVGDVFTVPKSALVQRGELSGVFIAKEGRAELRWLSLGEAAGDLLPVRSGLKADDKVVLDGLANPMVRPGAKIVPQKAQIAAKP